MAINFAGWLCFLGTAPSSLRLYSSPASVARQLARAMGAEELFGVFHQQHPDGTAPVDRLPTLFAAAGLPASEEGIAAPMVASRVESARRSVAAVTVGSVDDIFQ